MKRLATVLLSLSLTLPFADVAVTQSTAHFHSHHRTKVIDGKDTPGLIPDSTAYRLFFLAVTATDQSPEELNKEGTHFAGIGLGFTDAVVARGILDDFRMQYDIMVKNYNSHPHPGQADDYKAFDASADQLVATTRDKLASVVTAGGMGRFHQHVQSEKKGMQLVTVQ